MVEVKEEVGGVSKDKDSPLDTAGTSKEAYFEMLRIWLHQANLYQNASACFPYFLMANNPQMFPNGASSQFPQMPLLQGQNSGTNQAVPNLPPTATPEERINQTGGYEYLIAPIWKRFVAESIDVTIIFMLKLFLTIAIVDILNLDFAAILDLNSIKTSIEDDYTQIFSMASELIVLELFTKVVVCVYEALWTAEGQGNMGGATPGKLIMGIRILHVETVLLLDPLPPPNMPLQNLNTQVRALVYPARNPGWKRALSRAFIKNMTVLFPVVFPLNFLFLFRNNRMAYDLLCKTIVVEENQVPTLRRP